MPGEGVETGGGYVDPKGPMTDKEVADWRASVDAWVEQPGTQAAIARAREVLHDQSVHGDDLEAVIAKRRQQVSEAFDSNPGAQPS